jgi:hypothetical protein
MATNDDEEELRARAAELNADPRARSLRMHVEANSAALEVVLPKGVGYVLMLWNTDGEVAIGASHNTPAVRQILRRAIERMGGGE